MSAAKKTGYKAEPVNGKFKMLIGLSSDDRSKLMELVERYKKTGARPDMAWVIRQLIRNAVAGKKVPKAVNFSVRREHRRLLILSATDRASLEQLVSRYASTEKSSSMTWVIRQLIQSAHAEKKLLPVVVNDDD